MLLKFAVIATAVSSALVAASPLPSPGFFDSIFATAAKNIEKTLGVDNEGRLAKCGIKATDFLVRATWDSQRGYVCPKTVPGFVNSTSQSLGVCDDKTNAIRFYVDKDCFWRSGDFYIPGFGDNGVQYALLSKSNLPRITFAFFSNLKYIPEEGNSYVIGGLPYNERFLIIPGPTPPTLLVGNMKGDYYPSVTLHADFNLR